MNRAELKLEAKNQLRHNWGWAVIIGLVMTIFVGFFFARPAINNSLKIANNVNDVMGTGSIDSLFKPAFWAGQLGPDTGLTFIGSFFMLSMVVTFLHFARGERLGFFKGIFSVFTDDRFVPEFLNYLCEYIFQFLWSLLLVIPGLIKSYSYAMTPYIVNDLVASGQKVHATTAITLSRQLMDGHKWELFVLNLSFIGWYLLSVLTFGIGYIWLVPYEQTTKANFYRRLAGDRYLRN